MRTPLGVGGGGNILPMIRRTGGKGGETQTIAEQRAGAQSGSSEPFINAAPIHNDAPMTAVPREELNAKLEATEARMDTRVAEVVGRIDKLLERQEGLDRLYGEKFDGLAKGQQEATSSLKSLKTTIIVTAIASVIGLYGANIALISATQDSFGAGREQGASLASTTAEIKQTQEQLKAMQARLEQAASGLPATKP